MSRRLISLSEDLQKLQDHGYDLEVRSGYLLVKNVPYVDGNRDIRRGILVAPLTTAGEKADAPGDHVVEFSGDYPCDANGSRLTQIDAGSSERRVFDDLTIHHRFSSKPVRTGKYPDFYEKMTAYVAILESPAQAIDPNVTARTYPVITTREDESVFKYMDTATSRAKIDMANKKLELAKIAIIGVGGTGSYVLDLVAKTPVQEIHLFDGDDFLTHNAFRAPSAASINTLNAKPKKVAHFTTLYSEMRRGIVAHDYYVDASNVGELKEMDFAFVCIDAGEAKQAIIESLEALRIAFIDVGMGIELVDDSLCGALRVTTSTPDRRDHFRTRVSLADTGIGEEYDSNIQVADLNALNAALAVIKWKKLRGFYLDLEKEHNSTYLIEGNALIGDDQA
jgi:hypothetical protein